MRFVTIVLDSGGVGALPDFTEYGDAAGANTLGNVARRVGGLALPSFERLGLGHLTPMMGVRRRCIPRRASPGCANAAGAKTQSPATGRWREL